MAAPAGVNSGSMPEPASPEPPASEAAASEPPAFEAPAPEAATSDTSEPATSEPGTSEATAELAGSEPTTSGLAGSELIATGPMAVEPSDPEPGEPAIGESAYAVPEPAERLTAAEPGRARGAGRLVAAVVVIVVIAAAAATGVLVVTTHGFRPKAVPKYRPPAVFSLRTGDCLNSSQNGLSVKVLSCATPHDAEVFATFSLAGSSWPGSAAVQQQASSGCAGRIAGYLNPQLLNAGLAQEYVYPNHGAWQAGVRTVVCEVSSSTGPLTGSVRQGG
jgi:hypothetical protein